MSVFTTAEEQLKILLTLRPTLIYGTPSGVKELCDYAARKNIQPPSVSVIFLSSVLISDTVRQEIETCFQGRVIGIYGSTEFKDLAHECEEGRYHSYFQSAVFEVDPDTGPRTGRLLITSFMNRAMPLIRFDIGDYATVGSDPCKFGRNSPYLAKISGREIEFLRLPDGRTLSPYRLTTAVETVPGLLKYRFVQGDALSLYMEVVLGDPGIPNDEKIRQIRENLRPVLGDKIDLPIRTVKRIERTRGGKHRIVSQSSRDGGTCPTISS